MRLVNLDEQLLRLYIIRDDDKYTAEQRIAIIDCINAVKDTPEELGYTKVAKEIEQFNKGRYANGIKGFEFRAD